jgi:3-deoxy-D-manno-octulosonic-acid transferase
MESFKDSVQVLVGRGGIQVATPDQLHKVARDLLLRPDELARLGVMAREAVGGVRGASARNVDHMVRLLTRGKAAS